MFNRQIFRYIGWGIVGFSALTSCSVIHVEDRAGMDQHLESTEYQQLNGTFSMGKTDSTANFYERPLWLHFSTDTLIDPHNCKVTLVAPNEKVLQISIYKNDSLVDETRVKGHFHNGYFKTRRQFRAKGIIPLVWILVEDFKYVGLTNENKLVVLNSGGSGFLLLVAFPLFAAGGGSFWDEYERAE